MYERIKRILDEWDPIELLYLNADEYLQIAEELADTINKDFTPRSVYIALKHALEIYGVDFRNSNEECMEAAKRILLSLQEN